MSEGLPTVSGDDNYDGVSENFTEVLWVCDPNLKLTYVSPAVKKNSGFTAEERLTQSVEQLITPDSIEKLRQLISEQNSIGIDGKASVDWSTTCSFHTFTKDGKTRPVEAKLSFIRDESGHVSEIMGINRDPLTLYDTHSILSTVHRATENATGSVFFERMVVQLSDSFNVPYVFIAEIKGDTATTLAFSKDGQCADNFQYPLADSPCENVMAGTSCCYPSNVRKLFPQDRGLNALGVVSYIGTPIFDQEGNLRGLLVLMDVQERNDMTLMYDAVQILADRIGAEMRQRSAEASLKESSDSFRAVFEQSPDASFIYTESGQLVDVNYRLLALFGYTWEEINSLDPMVLLVDTDRAIAQKHFEVLKKNGTTRYASNCVKKSGEIFPVEATSNRIRVDRRWIIQTVLRDLTEEHHLREQARPLQEQMQQMLDGMETMVGLLDTDGAIRLTNKMPLMSTGVEANQIIGRQLWDTPWFKFDPESKAEIKTIVNDALDGKSTTRDLRIQTLKGLAWVAFNIHPIMDENGHVTQLIADARDISDRKNMEESLLAQEQRRELFRTQAPMAVVEWNPESHQVLEWNVAAEKMFGFTSDEIRGQTPDFLVPEGIQVNTEQIFDALISQQQSSVISKNRTKDGRTIICEWYNSPIVDGSGKMLAVVSIVRDITAEQQTQKALEDREAEQRGILESMMEGVFTIDENGTLLSFNKAAETLFGYQADKIVGQNSWQLLTERYALRYKRLLDLFLETHDPHYLGITPEIEGLRENGETFPTRLSIAKLPTTLGGQHRFIISCQDLSHFKQQEEQLRRSQKMDALGKLTGGIAHDFNNMLGVISGYTDLILQAVDDQPKLANYADNIAQASERGAQLTEKLLGFSQQKKSSSQILAINTLIEAQQNMLERTLTPRIKLALDLDKNLWPLYIDGGDLVDAVLNISINAMHAMPRGGQLDIQTRNVHIDIQESLLKDLPEGDFVLLSITDTGSGMDESTREKIFDPFFSTKGDAGTGLGLSQVYGFVDRSNGSIRVSSEPDQGTQLTLYFPRYEADDNEDNSETESSDPVNLEGKESILVVDDEAVLLYLTKEILSLQGYQVITAENGKQALEILATKPIDLMLSDVIMPGLDGYELATIVRQKYPDVKIQLASGYTDDRKADIGTIDLHNALLNKPYQTKVLLARLRELLD